MTMNAILQIGLFVVVLGACVKPVGLYMARVYSGRAPMLERILGPIERFMYRLGGITREQEMTWRQYSGAVVAFSFVSVVTVYAIERLQGALPLNPESLPAVSHDSSFNTAVSFATNTNWQGYSGETTMSYLTQMLALTVQNFLS
ncbi:MAG: potassium-transporting ATPase subunit KdpA, partial [Pirellulaceae bacterium]